MATKINKTYKMYIDGQFPRTESGRYYTLKNNKNELIANVCLGSRKDIRNSVSAARKAQLSWNGKTAYLKSQIVYRIAEMLDGRSAQFLDELLSMGFTKVQAQKEIQDSIDLLVYYAGWADKYQALFSSVNPVSSSHFNFSVLEPSGLVSVFCPEKSPLAGIIATTIPAILSGNTVIALASEQYPLCAVTFGEVIHSSDLPAGVLNIITGSRKELFDHMANHMDVNTVIYTGNDKKELYRLKELAVDNVKRVVDYTPHLTNPSPYAIYDTQEVKTTWHPIENIGVGGAKY